MKRMMNLVLFELRKILNHKKAFLFLLVLNIIPIVASFALMVAYISSRGFGFGDIQFAVMKNAIRSLFTGHFTCFGYIAPFFLALIVGDSFSTEFGRGYMKMLLVTPVRRWQVITAKSLAIILFLLIAVLLGGIILQGDLFVAKSITQPSGILPETLQNSMLDNSLVMVTPLSAFQLLVITFVANLAIIGFLVGFSMFFESAILMAFCSLSALMGIQVFYWSSSLVEALVEWFGPVGKLCFTRYYLEVFSIKTIHDVLSGEISLFATKVIEPLGFCLLWAVFFYGIATFIFSKKQILH